jgi:hypothetical protein
MKGGTFYSIIILLSILVLGCSGLNTGNSEELYYRSSKRTTTKKELVKSEGIGRDGKQFSIDYKKDQEIVVLGRLKFQNDSGVVQYKYLVENDSCIVYVNPEDILVDTTWGEPVNDTPTTTKFNPSLYNKNTSTYINTGTGKDIKTGERGGQYYINDNGKKTYIKKKK